MDLNAPSSPPFSPTKTPVREGRGGTRKSRKTRQTEVLTLLRALQAPVLALHDYR